MPRINIPYEVLDEFVIISMLDVIDTQEREIKENLSKNPIKEHHKENVANARETLYCADHILRYFTTQEEYEKLTHHAER